ncbi:MAG: aminopeptidase N [Paraglaciecola sp.]|jgi:aminopeptidase N
MSDIIPTIKKRSDYQEPDFLIEQVKLVFNLDGEQTQVTAISTVKRKGNHSKPLVLDGEELTLVKVCIDGVPCSDYVKNSDSLCLAVSVDEFELEITTGLNPANNKSLEGLYLAAGAYCTQCEAEGFRKITYFLDRPDVLATYEVTIYADKVQYPYLLSNGNQTGHGDLDDGRHWVTWQDPFKKPCYLFALVAGDFDLLEDQFTTQSGRDVALQLFVDRGALAKGHHALASLKKAMAWDEQIFGLEYDLDIYMIVAVDFFNMGAMENKGLNVFNSKYVLADAQSATDEDYFNIEAVIGHEYFHNWTGNRVTCRDWFQLSLKEGLTVFRDQQFSADMSSPVINRIKNVRIMREQQFAEDASAMSHPIRPDEVMEMNNFYTVTVYDKGAEVIRMLHTLLGVQGFRQGMDLYFQRFDGQAVTCDDFVQVMEDATKVDLNQFRLWYSQSGTPKVKVSDTYDAASGEYCLLFEQINLPTAEQPSKQNLHIPIKFELLDETGHPVVQADVPQLNNKLIELTERTYSLKLSGLKTQPVPSLLHDFSAPVKLEYPYTSEQLQQVMLHSSDDFARWDASQTLYSRCIHSLADDRTNDSDSLIASVMDAANSILATGQDNPALMAEMLYLPSFETLSQQVNEIHVEALFNAQRKLQKRLAGTLQDKWLAVYQQQKTGPYQYNAEQVNARRLRNLCLAYLVQADAPQATNLLHKQYEQADNMSDTLGVLKAAQFGDLGQFDQLMQGFEQKWRHDPLVIDKWFALQANTSRPDILPRLELLMSHSQFSMDNPNRVRSLVGSFAFYNVLGFHAADGSGYKFIGDYLLRLNSVNPQVAARIITPLIQWQKFDPSRQKLMRQQLLRIADCPELSKDLLEKVSKSLDFTR